MVYTHANAVVIIALYNIYIYIYTIPGRMLVVETTKRPRNECSFSREAALSKPRGDSPSSVG